MRRTELLNIFLVLILIFILLPNVQDLANTVLRHKFFSEFLAVALGVMGGFFSSYVIESVKLKRSVIGSLEALRGEILANKTHIKVIIEGIENIPALSDSSHFSDKEAIIMLDQAEKSIANHAKETLTDNGYVEMTETLVELENTILLKQIVDSYLKLNKVRSSLLMITVDHPIDHKSHLKENRKIGEEEFKKELSSLRELLSTWEDFDREVVREIASLKKKLIYRLI